MNSSPRSADNFWIRNATAIAIITVTALMFMATLTFYRQGEASQTARGRVVHTYEVRGHIQALFSDLKDAELGERGYLLTGDDEYLEPYRDVIKNSVQGAAQTHSLEEHHSITEELDILRNLTSDNPRQQRNLDELDGVVKDLLNYWAGTVQLQSNQDKSAIQRESKSHYGKQLMDHVRIMVRVMEAEETSLLAVRIEADETSTRQNNGFTYSAIAVFYIAMTLSIWFYQRSRARSQAQLLRYTQDLEKSEEELKMQQEELKASNEEIEASNEELEEKTRALEEQNAQIQQQSEELNESKRLIEEKANELERASKYKSEFLANMSHELRTPLNSLLILAKLLAANEDGNLTDEQVEATRVIHNGGLELLGLINDILDLSKVEAGKLNLTSEDVALDSIVKHMQQQFAPVAKDKGVEFVIQSAENLPAQLYTDSQRVEQILKNLLSNAFKFTERGSVTLKMHRPDKNVELQRNSLAHDSVVAFSVTDTGIGIEGTKLKDIFEAFQQEDGSIDRHYGGTGLGLTIARKFAHMLGGEIHVRSIKGEGSTFTLLLPTELMHQESQKKETEAETDNDRVPMRVMPRTSVAEFISDDRRNIGERDKVLLIIEDDRNFAATLIKIAHRRGYKCLAAGDGKTGLVLAMEQPVTAIILDLKLPDIDGMQVLDQLKHNLKSRHIPVHIISGRAETENVVPLRKGAIGYLTKPVEVEAIDGVFTKIETLLQSEVKQVLVVEDDKKSQVAIQALLKKKDVQLTMAGTGAEALQQIAAKNFDCVILDLRLPDMTGFEWLEKMEKDRGEGGAPPVIVYTAKELTEDENRQLNRYTGSIIIKGAKSPERLLDEVTLFLHSVESTLSADQQEIIRMQHDPDRVLQGRTLLLVDDDLRNTFALSKLLKKHGMNVVIADNGQMALDKLQQEKAIELVIMDIMMPVMDGYQAMQEIRAQKVFRNLPMIALTARAMPEEQEKCMAAGANDYLTKPVDIERLLTLLRVWLFRQEMAA